MKIAILGASSQIAKDLICALLQDKQHELYLFGRDKIAIDNWCLAQGINKQCSLALYDEFASRDIYDVIINFVGIGDPQAAQKMGSQILAVTHYYDQLVLDYLTTFPTTKYIFLSSGAVFGGDFSKPVANNTVTHFCPNQLASQDLYGIAKLYAEARHRAMPEYSIIDIRVFTYFSHTQNMQARFLMTDIVRAIQSQTVLQTSTANIVRDFITPSDFAALVRCVLTPHAINLALDCYTQAPIDKLSLLTSLQNQFGLRYELVADAGVKATGCKMNYYSENKQAATLGYLPQYSSLTGIERELKRYLQAFAAEG